MILQLVDDVEKALSNGCYFSALALALTLPDACGRAEYGENGIGKRYRDWCKNFCITDFADSKCSNDMPYLSEEVLYQLRCSFLHQSTPSIEPTKINEERCKIDKNEFVLSISNEPFLDNGTSMVSYNIKEMKIAKRGYEISIDYLCHMICVAAAKYYKENKEKFSFINFRLIDKRKEDF